jgi:ATP-dependent Clp protease ATP-binding subunit ClpA
LSLNHNYVGTEHLLLGLVRENDGVAAGILLDFDAHAEKIRNEIIRLLSRGAPAESVGEPFVSGAETWLAPMRLPLPELDAKLLGLFIASQRRVLVVAVLALVSFPAGLLVGWLIWH